MYTVNETSNVSMVCRANSEPQATITWSKTGSNEILAYGEQFQIFNTSKHDDGTYICTATNYLGSDSRKVFLNVQSKFNNGHNVKFIPTQHKTTFSIYSNSWLIFSADPTPQIKLYIFLLIPEEIKLENKVMIMMMILRKTCQKHKFGNVKLLS